MSEIERKRMAMVSAARKKSYPGRPFPTQESPKPQGDKDKRDEKPIEERKK